MSREWCIPLELASSATVLDEESIEAALRMISVDFERDGHVILCFVDAPHSPKRVKKDILEMLGLSELDQRVVTPLRVFRWDEEREEFVDPHEVTAEVEAAAKPFVPLPDEMLWGVTATPVDVFHERRVREELERRGRVIIGERHAGLEVGARDEADARALIAELKQVPDIRKLSARPLGWFARWRIRESLLGNYKPVVPDPTLPW